MTAPHDFTGAPCVSHDPDEQRVLIALFDSLKPADHAYAATLCATCDHQAPCETRRRQVVDDFSGRTYEGPQGTWAGRKYGRAERAMNQ